MYLLSRTESTHLIAQVLGLINRTVRHNGHLFPETDIQNPKKISELVREVIEKE